jgi:hypothetical protein
VTRHEALFASYATDLGTARRHAQAWWADLVEREVAAGPSLRQAKFRLNRRWPDGPASHPAVLHVIRKYWLACDTLNEAILAEELNVVPDAATMSEEYVLDTSDDEDEADDEVKADGEVYPHIFILEWLMDGKHDALASFIGKLSYWPIGLDARDRYT